MVFQNQPSFLDTTELDVCTRMDNALCFDGDLIRENFEQIGHIFDILFDTVGNSHGIES